MQKDTKNSKYMIFKEWNKSLFKINVLSDVDKNLNLHKCS